MPDQRQNGQPIHHHDIILDEDDPLLDNAKRPGELMHKRKGKYIEIPNVLDGFLMLNRAPAEDPEYVYHLDISGCALLHVIEDDLTMFTNLHTLHCGENKLPFAKLGVIPGLRRLVMPANQIKDLDLEVEGRFLGLEELDMSYNRLSHAGIIVLATLPSLRQLDLSSNNIKSLPGEIVDMIRWRDRVIERILPKYQLEALDGWLTAEKDKMVETSGSVALNLTTKGTETPDVAPLSSALAEPSRASAVPFSANLSTEDSTFQPGDEPYSRKTHVGIDLTTVTEENLNIVVDSGEGSLESVNVGEDATRSSNVSEPRSSLVAEEEPAEEELEDETGGSVAEVEATQTTQESLETLILPVTLSEPAPKVDMPQSEVAPSAPAPRPFLMESPGGPGFKKLETLILDNNRLNTAEAFEILSALPSLKRLDLSRNQITTLDFLSTSATGTSTAPQKYPGFYTLLELHLTHNSIEKVSDLVGVVWLPALERVWLEGNPVMNRTDGKLEIKDAEQGEVIGYIPFNPLRDLPAQYNITVADPVYHTPHVLVPIKSTANSAATSAIQRQLQKPKATHSKFLSHLNRKNGPPAIPAAHIVASYTVAEVRDKKEAVEMRNMKRAYRYTEEDLKEIVKTGRIPDVEELIQLAERRAIMNEEKKAKVDKDADESVPDGQNLELSSKPDSHPTLHYDPTASDPTFITGVHITDKPIQQSSSFMSTPPRSPSPIDYEMEDEVESFPLPKTLPASLRALRHALTHSSPTALLKPYAHPTFSFSRKRIPSPPQNRRRFRDTKPGKQLYADEDMPSKPLPRLHTPSALASIQRSQTARRWRPKDEFAEMRELMHKVDERIQIVETNMVSLWKSRKPAYAKIIPHSQKLLQEVQNEYERIERMYTVAAMAGGDNAAEDAPQNEGVGLNRDEAVKGSTVAV